MRPFFLNFGDKLLSVLYSEFLSRFNLRASMILFTFNTRVSCCNNNTISWESQRDSLPNKHYLFIIPRALVYYSLRFITRWSVRSISFYQSHSIYKSRKILSYFYYVTVMDVNTILEIFEEIKTQYFTFSGAELKHR